MPHDKNGRKLEVGHRVIIQAVVTQIVGMEDYCNLFLETIEPLYPGEYKTSLILNSKQVERVNLVSFKGEDADIIRCERCRQILLEAPNGR